MELSSADKVASTVDPVLEKLRLAGLTGRVGNPIMGFMETPTIIPLAALERIMILRTMKQYPNMKDAAKVLGIGKTTLYRKLKEYKEKGQM